jgi:hypothetical protein
MAGFEDLSFEDALEQEEVRIAANRGTPMEEIQPQSYFYRGLYAQFLAPFFTYFPRNQLLLLRSDALLEDQNRATTKIFRFVGANPDYIPPAKNTVEFSSPEVIDPKLQHDLRKKYGRDLDGAIQRLRSQSPLVSDLDRMLQANVKEGYTPLSTSLRAQLKERYRNANQRFAQLVPFSVEDWL